MKTVLAVVGSGFLIAAAPPPDPGTREDVRCFVALAYLADTDDAKVKEAAMAGTLYFLGRLDGRTPGLDLESEVATVAETFADGDMKSLLQSCSVLIEQRGEYLVAAGKALEKRGKLTSKRP